MLHAAGHIRTEAEYFHQIDAELIEEMRKRAAAEEEHRRLAEATHLENPKIIDALEKLGYTHTTVILLHLVPLVELAWIDGAISCTERGHILALARERGITGNTHAYQQLMAWLDQRPSAEFFEGTWRAIQATFESMAGNQRTAAKNALVETCTEFASASCERSGWTSRICAAKRHLLKEIARRLDRESEVERSAALAGSAHTA